MDQTAKRRSLRRSAGKWNRYEPAASDAEIDAIGSPCNKGRSFQSSPCRCGSSSTTHHDVEGHSPRWQKVIGDACQEADGEHHHPDVSRRAQADLKQSLIRIATAT